MTAWLMRKDFCILTFDVFSLSLKIQGSFAEQVTYG
jgi:hypothetical protein